MPHSRWYGNTKTLHTREEEKPLGSAVSMAFRFPLGKAAQTSHALHWDKTVIYPRGKAVRTSHASDWDKKVISPRGKAARTSHALHWDKKVISPRGKAARTSHGTRKLSIHGGKQPELPMDRIGTRQLSNLSPLQGDVHASGSRQCGYQQVTI